MLVSFTYDAAQSGPLAAGGHYDGTLTANLPGMVPGDYRIIVRSNLNRQLAEKEYSANKAVSTGTIAVSIPTLDLDGAQAASVPFGTSLYYQIVVPPANAGQALIVDFGTANTTATNRLYLVRDRVPTPRDYDLAVTTPPTSAPRAAWPNLAAGTYYVLAQTDPSPAFAGQTAVTTITARAVVIGVFDTTYGRGGTAGERTIEVHGVNLDPAVTVRLVNPATGASFDVAQTQPVDSSRMQVTFDLRSVPPGTYDVVFRSVGGQTATVAAGLEVIAADPQPVALVPSITAPTAFRRPRYDSQIAATTYPFTVTWQNTGLNDIPLAVFEIRSSEPFVTSPSQVAPGAGVYTMTVWGTPDGAALPGRLAPGQSVTKTFYTVPDTRITTPALTPITYSARRLFDDPGAAMDWSTLEAAVHARIPDTTTAATVLGQIKTTIGTTVGDYVRFLAANITPADRASSFEAFDAALLDRTVLTTWAAVTPSITGRVETTATGLDVTNRTVSAVDAAGRAFTATTDRNGGFVLAGLAAGTYTLRIDGLYLEGDATVTVAADQHFQNVVVQASLGATISGTITAAATGQAVADVYVFAFDTQNQIEGSAKSDATGHYSLAGIKPNSTIVLTTQSDNFAPAYVSVAVTDALAQDLALAAPGQITGQLQGRTSYDNVFVTATNTTVPSPFGIAVGTVNADGSFTFSGLAAGTYTLQAADSLGSATVASIVVPVGQPANAGTVVLSTETISLAQAAALAGVSPLQTSSLDCGCQPPAHIAAETPPLLLLPVLVGVKDELQRYFIPVMLARWGFVDAMLWQMYLDGDPAHPYGMIYFGEGSDLVEGSWVAKGFRDSGEISQWAALICQQFSGAVRRYYAADPQRVCADARSGSQSVTLDQLLSASGKFGQVLTRDDICNPVNFAQIFTLPGNLAGGCGMGDDYSDSRTMSGSFDVQVQCDGSISITPHLSVTVVDTIDFMAGDVGAGIEQVVTRQLRFLERYGFANDVPYTVAFDIRTTDLPLGPAVLQRTSRPARPPTPAATPPAIASGSRPAATAPAAPRPIAARMTPTTSPGPPAMVLRAGFTRRHRWIT